MKRDRSRLGPLLKGKIHIYCGDMDNYYLNNAVYRAEDCGAHCSPSLKGFEDMLIFGYAAVGEADIRRTVAALAAFSDGNPS